MLAFWFVAHRSRPHLRQGHGAAPQDEGLNFIPHAEEHRACDASKHGQRGKVS
jgi:hypothetical protein